jgi:hypothetical protein
VDVPLIAMAENAMATADGKLSIINIFDRIVVGAFPAVHPAATFVAQLRAPRAEAGRSVTVTFRLMDDENIIFETEAEITAPASWPQPTAYYTLNQIITLRGLPVPHPGEYSFYVLVDGEEKARVKYSASTAEQLHDQAGT